MTHPPSLPPSLCRSPGQPDLAGVKAALNSALRGNVDSVVAGVKKRLGEGSSGGRGLRRALQADNMSIMAVLGTSAVPTVPVVAAAPGVQSRTTTTEGGAG